MFLRGKKECGYMRVAVEADDEKMMELDGLMYGPIWLQADAETD